MKIRIALIISLLSLVFSFATIADDNGIFSYKIENDTVTIVSYIGPQKVKKIEFPSFIDDKPVTLIGSDHYEGDVVGLYEWKQKTELVFPEGIKEINGPFYTMGSFGTVRIPASVVKIGIAAFSYTDITEFVFDGAPEDIEDSAFSQNNHLKK